MVSPPLVHFIRQRSAAAFIAAYKAYRGLAVWTAYRVLGDWEAAQDVAQDVFMHLYEDPPSLPLAGGPHSYIAAMAYGRATDRVASEACRREHELEAARQGVARKGDVSLEGLREAIGKLDEHIRVVFELRVTHGLPWVDVCRAVPCTRRTAFRRFDAGKRILKGKLGPGALIAFATLTEAMPEGIPTPRLDRWAEEMARTAFPATPAAMAVSSILKIAVLVLVVALSGLLFVRTILGTGDDRIDKQAPVAMLHRDGDPDPDRGRSPAPGPAVAVAPERVLGDREAPAKQVLSGGVWVWDSQEPVAGARIRLQQNDRECFGTSQTDGSFELPIDAGPITELLVAHDGFVSSRVLLAGKTDVPLKVFLVPQRPIRVRVVDAESKQPLAGAELGIRASDETLLAQTLTNDQGEGELRIAEISLTLLDGEPKEWPPALGLAVTAQGHERRIIVSRLAELSAKQETRLVLVQPTLSLLGRVFDPQGQPVAGTRIVLSPLQAPKDYVSDRPVWDLYTDNEGSFVAAVAPAAAPWVIAAVKEGFAPGFLELGREELRAGTEIAINLPEGHIFRGRIWAQDGRVLTGAAVVLEPRSGRLATSWPHFFLLRQHFGGNPFRGTTGQDGVVSISDVPAGSYQIVLEADSLPVATDVSIPTAGLWEGRVDQTQDLYCVVVDRTGKPIPDARALPPPSPSGSPSSAGKIVNDKRGGFRIRGIKELPCKFLIAAPPYALIPAEVNQRFGQITFLLDAPSQNAAPLSRSLSARVSWDGALPESEVLSVTLDGRERRELRLPIRHGIIELCGIPPGVYDLTFSLKGFAPARFESTELPKPDPIEVRLETQN